MEYPDRQKRFSACVFDPKTGDLTRHGMKLRLEQQPKAILRLLIEANGDLVSRASLIAELWPGESEGDFDRRLDKAIAKLRACLNDNPHHPRSIETLRGLGYRLLPKVLAEPAASGDRTAGGESAAHPIVQLEAAAAFEQCDLSQAPLLIRQFKSDELFHPFPQTSAEMDGAPSQDLLAGSRIPRLELLCKALITVDSTREMGSDSVGDHRLAPVLSGWFEGARLKGKILPGSIDWQRVRSDNVIEFEAHYTLVTVDGVPIRVALRGYRRGPNAAGKEIEAAKAVYSYRAAPIFDAPSGRYDWLNRSLFLCAGERSSNSVVIHFFEVL